ncbi:MAG: hypothetical protein BWK79_05165 [Beggiatoa sp. IS2]|nr:MAG: hypothetical protein BWK79_05165 [Beggiatoa sp. IS2]
MNWGTHGSLGLTIANSGLPSNTVLAVSPDDRGGLWAGTDAGLTHLTFSRKTQLCEQSQNNATCESLRAGKRAAIIVAGGGAQRSNTLWDTTESITSYLYRVFAKRGFDNDEIYYVSPKSWADFNGDGRDDFIVDGPKPEAPLTAEDIRTAFNWAKQRGKLDQPLYLFFVDHGAVDKLQLSEVEKLGVVDLKALLDDYQTMTGNEMIVVVDACYSGVLLEQLTAPKRALISSTSNGLAYFERTEKQGFSRFLAKGLDKGMPFMEAFTYANREQEKLLGDMSKLLAGSIDPTTSLEQVPKYDDGSNGNWLSSLYLNNITLVTGDDTLAIVGVTPAATLTAGESFLLQARTSGRAKQAWVVLRPPKINLLLDSSGTPILAYPRIDLEQTTDNPELWQITWSDAVYNGTYQITFYAEDNDSNVTSSEQNMVLTVSGGIDPPDQAQIQVSTNKDRYQRGEPLTAQLTENLNWGYDLYAAVVLPDGNFLALKNTNELYGANEAKKWLKMRKQNSTTTLLDLTLPEDLPTGQYCLYGILSPEQQNVLEMQSSWVWEQKCFEIF